MTFVSAQGKPIARRFGLWALDPNQDGMTPRAGDDATAGQGAAAAPVHRGESLVGRAAAARRWCRKRPRTRVARWPSRSSEARGSLPRWRGTS